MINISYFSPETPEEENSNKKSSKGLLSPKQVMESAKKKAQKMSKPKSDLIERTNGKLLTDDGREIFNENK